MDKKITKQDLDFIAATLRMTQDWVKKQAKRNLQQVTTCEEMMYFRRDMLNN